MQNGLFVGKAPHGYRNVRRDGRSLVELDPQRAPIIRRIFDLYAYGGHTLDSLIEQLLVEGVQYCKSQVRFNRAKLHTILRDRAYIGEVRHRDNWYPGVHEALTDRTTFDRVGVLLGEKVYRTHDMLYASELLTCGHCGHPITGECKTRQTKRGEVRYIYYRCAKYNTANHPRVRLAESALDQQVLALFAKLRIQEEHIRDWFLRVLRERTREQQVDSQVRNADLSRQLTSLRQQQDRLLNLRLLEEIDEHTFAAKSTELRDRVAHLSLEVDACDRDRAERADIAEKAFELSQSLTEKWLTAGNEEKRQLLEIVCLNFVLDGATLVPIIRKPFDVLAEGLVLQYSRGDMI